MSHRRAAIKQKRVRQVKRQIALICSVIVVAIVLLLVTRVHHEDEAIDHKAQEEMPQLKKEEVNTDTQAEADSEELKEVNETEEEHLKRVKKEAIEAGYPEKVIELLSKNPETVDFVEAYGENKDISSPATIEEFKEGEIPMLIQWDKRWGYAPYGTGIIAVCGCGPTCLSMVLSSLTGDNTLTPVVLAEYGTEHGYVTDNNDTSWSFMTEACKEWDVKCKEVLLNEEEILKELDKGHPVVCSVGPGDFTQTGHFILIAGHENGELTVYDPFSIINSNKKWRYEDFEDQIKVIWVYSK